MEREGRRLKKLTKKAKERNERIARKRLRVLAKGRRNQQRARRARCDKSATRKDSPIRIVAPVVFSVESNETRRPVTKFFSDLRTTFAREEVKAITIDLSRTEKFVSIATLLFFAELSRLMHMAEGRVRVRCKPPVNDRACQVLHQIGVYEMCGQHVRRKRTHYEDVVHWRAAHGAVVDNSICAPAIEEFEGQLAPPLVNGLFRGLSEAMTNAIHHAYLDVREDGLNYRPKQSDWWMFSQARQGYLSVVFCDLGIGIPRTLPIKKPSLIDRILAMGKESLDSAYIEEAIEDSRTRTHRPERGKGLGNIVEVVAKLDGGRVMIFSNRGLYFLKSGLAPKTQDFKDSILGTLIFWRVPLAKDSRHG